ncbi:hypothetical protein JJB09_07285 [Rhizobium sp. KVB221]|uniref:Uncharacterized protein n=1 Tax=Rhizobium setariae TaxID=2801340 RepID=A0A937CNB5_9HYPH|nr:hypothetical protein [Rhizobium setariae]MBL0371829.1 hypothetical protein [Rhizobium setariae]
METTCSANNNVPISVRPQHASGLSTMISAFRKAIRQLGETEDDATMSAWRDPLMHPEIQRMSSRELADLPLSAGYGKYGK